MMDGGDTDGGRIEMRKRSEALFDGGEGGDAELRGGFGSDGCAGLDDGGELYGLASLLELFVDAKVIASKGSSPDDGDLKWMGGGHLLDGSFNGLPAARVELQQRGDLIFGLGRRCNAEPGGTAGLSGDVRRCSDKLQQIQGDVFGAACGVGCGIHEKRSLSVIKVDVNGWYGRGANVSPAIVDAFVGAWSDVAW